MDNTNNKVTDDIEDMNVERIKKEIKEQLDNISKMTLEIKQKINEETKFLIKHYADMSAGVELRRSLFGMMFHINAFIVLMLVIYLIRKYPIRNASSFYVTLCLLLFFLLITIFEGLRRFYIQSLYRYPFLKIKDFSNKNRWFYYGDKNILKINTSTDIFSEKDIERDNLHYLKSLSNLIKDFTNKSLDQELRENIIQLQVMRVHNYYKNRFYLQIAQRAKLMFIESAIIAAYADIVYLFPKTANFMSILSVVTLFIAILSIKKN